MKPNPKAKFLCRECGWNQPCSLRPTSVCPGCGQAGTVYIEEAAWPTAAGGTANARRLDDGSAASRGRSPFDEEARALTAGPVELWRRMDDIVDEARDVWVAIQNRNLQSAETRFDKLWKALVKLRKDATPKAEIGPAVSVKSS